MARLAGVHMRAHGVMRARLEAALRERRQLLLAGAPTEERGSDV
jgi:hypothetical protein